jgi:predicted metal-dependent hydrolase
MELSFKYNSRKIPYTVVYRKRKTMAIRVEPPGQITVVAPAGTKRNFIEEKVQAKAAWIIEKLDHFQSVQANHPQKHYINGESFYFLGESYCLQMNLNPSLKKASVAIYPGVLQISSPSGDEQIIKNALEQWYRQKAREEINARVQYFQAYIHQKPNRIVIKEQKRRWGSCSSQGNLNFNWRIIMAPRPVVDYLVVHEMSHLIHLNHSKQFWDLVKSILPDYKASKEWLRNNGLLLRNL